MGGLHLGFRWWLLASDGNVCSGRFCCINYYSTRVRFYKSIRKLKIRVNMVGFRGRSVKEELFL